LPNMLLSLHYMFWTQLSMSREPNICIILHLHAVKGHGGAKNWFCCQMITVYLTKSEKKKYSIKAISQIGECSYHS